MRRVCAAAVPRLCRCRALCLPGAGRSVARRTGPSSLQRRAAHLAPLLDPPSFPFSQTVYYYITNYLAILGASLLLLLLRRPLALVGAALGVVALLSLNDPFSAALK